MSITTLNLYIKTECYVQMVLDFRKEMVSYIISRMDGSNDLDNISKTKPSKKYVLGCLAARDLSKLEDYSKDIYNINTDTSKASIRATTSRVSILTDKINLDSAQSISVTASGYVFYKVKTEDENTEDEEETETSLSNSKKDKKYEWKRQQFIQKFEIDLELEKYEYTKYLDFSKIIQSCNNDQASYTELPLDNWQVEVKIILKKYIDQVYVINFYFSNTSSEDRNKDFNFEKTLFDCKLRIDIGNIRPVEFKEDYSYNGNSQRYFYDFRTINCQAKFIDSLSKSVFETNNYFQFEERQIEAVSQSESYDLSFETLSSDNYKENLEKLLQEMKLLQMKYGSISSENDDKYLARIGNRQTERTELEDILKNFNTQIEAYNLGLESLNSNKNAKIAFKSMNLVFDNYYKNKLGPTFDSTNPPSWRIFQIVFILSAIRSISGGTDLDIVDVLHISTGGGKSEAYFGLIVFSMFYERLSGKPDGVTAIVKFPLRMLSIQQLERLASIVIYAEDVRKQHEELFKGTEFSLGYYVGNSEDFPDLYSKVKGELYLDSKFQHLKKDVPSNIISDCPLCEYSHRGKIYLVDDAEHKRVLHQCNNNKNHTFFIYYSDREVFRYRPTVIVSTVDKWASLAFQKRLRSLLGGKGSYCPDGHGFIPSGTECENTEGDLKCNNVGKNEKASSGPILSIQDEIHLLEESFGTIASHFEGLIDETISELSNGQKLKHIAMSATLNGVDLQIKELYKKNAFVISGESSLIANPSFDLIFHKTGKTKRLIYGLIPNLRDNHYATLRTILHAIEFLDGEQRDFINNPEIWIHKYGMKHTDEAIQTFKDFITILTYHLKKQDAEDMLRFSEPVIDNALEKRKISTHGSVVTGDMRLDQLKKTIDSIKSRSATYSVELQTSVGAKYEPIFATSVVSHGVDLEELNFMIFQGIPYSTSEYIQALSRVGRKREGIVLVWLYPNRVRDQSFYRNFGRYHEALDHEVLPIPIKSMSKLGIKQTINSLFCAGILQLLSNEKDKPLIHKSDVEDLTDTDEEKLLKFIKNSYGKHFNIDIEPEMENRIKQIRESHNKSSDFFPKVLEDSGNHFYHNQSGMRGIQSDLILVPEYKTLDILRHIEGD